ncbi:MAG TPA: hypothetical protein VI997_00440 [Candidatus Thermoplasmatota archaeon]|nr:hypothetical protein [Candidatus Thermoplasmatota archaeon]
MPKKAPRRRKAPRFPIAYVRYHDHCWLDARELEKIKVAKPVVVEETGFLLHETPKFITLARERATDGERGRTTYESVTILMRSDILEMHVLALPRRARARARAR